MNHVVEAKSIFRVSAEDAFDVFADPSQMSQYWFNRRDEGLCAGETIMFFMGRESDAQGFPVRIKKVARPDCLVVEWGEGEDQARIEWAFESLSPQQTIVRIKESQHKARGETLISRLLDSTGGFNQVIIAAKALVEHGVSINVVADHA